MNNELFNDKVIERIRNESLTPRSRWLFVTEHWLFVSLIGIATFVGSIAVAATLFVLTDHDWFAVSYLNESLAMHIIKTVPYVWLAIIVLVVTLITTQFKKIDRGYRTDAWKIILLSLLASLSIGTAFYLSGFGAFLDSYLDRSIPSYRTVVPSNRTIWVYPERGLLSGKIRTVKADSLTLIDTDGEYWNVSFDKDTAVKAAIIPGKEVKITGEMLEHNTFDATAILPWRNERK